MTGAHRFKRTVAGVCVSYFGEGKQGYTEDTPSSRVYFRPFLLSIGGAFLFKFLGRIPVIYHNPGRKDTYGKNGVKPYLIHVYYRDGRERVYKEEIPYPCSEEVRSMKVSKIYIELR